MLTRCGDLALVGEFEDAPSALAGAQAMEPRAAVISVDLSGSDGVSLVRSMATAAPSCGCVLLVERSLARYSRAAMLAGARGCVASTHDEETLVRAVRDAARGASSFPEAAKDASFDMEQISSREREVLLLAARGMLHKEIAARLFISQRTVQTHLASVYDKLGARNKTEATLAALRRGVVVIEELFEEGAPLAAEL